MVAERRTFELEQIDVAATSEEERQPSDLIRQMLRESSPNAAPDRWNDVTRTEAVVNLAASAGGTD